MKILFVSSGNGKEAVSSLVYNQGESIKRKDADITYFTIKGKGIFGYVTNIFRLIRFLKEQKFEIIHAHYSFSGYVASLAGAKPLVVSLMGSDVKSNIFNKILIRIFFYFYWKSCIVKSEDMKKTIGLNGINVVPNGVDINIFKPINKEFAIEQLHWNKNVKHILFAANPNRKEKNFKLAKQAFDLLNNIDLELHVLQDVPNSLMSLYYNAADVILLTSLWEGSPNVVKEAMACNIPVVSTDVGDVRENTKGLEGYYICSTDPNDIAMKLILALNYNSPTKGRERIVDLHLDSESTADSLIHIYNSIFSNNKVN